jgi:multicomponent Na+:H+ antiporter subunit B
MVILVEIALLALLGVTAVAILRLRNLFGAVMLAGIYSLLSAALFTTLDAVDVAFTEAAVGAGISTVLFLGTLALVGNEEKRPQHRPLLPFFVVLVTGAALVYGTLDLPPFGAADNPVHVHVAPEFIRGSAEEIQIPNVVTSVLASYRGYDTMGEVTVVFTAIVGVLLLLSRGRRPRRVWDEENGRWETRWIAAGTEADGGRTGRPPVGDPEGPGDVTPLEAMAGERSEGGDDRG